MDRSRVDRASDRFSEGVRKLCLRRSIEKRAGSPFFNNQLRSLQLIMPTLTHRCALRRSRVLRFCGLFRRDDGNLQDRSFRY
jgi:hypothetical protein